MPNLYTLDLYNNPLTGAIPDFRLPASVRPPSLFLDPPTPAVPRPPFYLNLPPPALLPSLIHSSLFLSPFSLSPLFSPPTSSLYYFLPPPYLKHYPLLLLPPLFFFSPSSVLRLFLSSLLSFSFLPRSPRFTSTLSPSPTILSPHPPSLTRPST
ncbi:hypothetical protein BGS_1127 [Beggiatoa sp. SS]|nr:hypothetical protein BGS_1127 [Beggiatoa sp. SS]